MSYLDSLYSSKAETEHKIEILEGQIACLEDALRQIDQMEADGETVLSIKQFVNGTPFNGDVTLGWWGNRHPKIADDSAYLSSLTDYNFRYGVFVSDMDLKLAELRRQLNTQKQNLSNINREISKEKARIAA